MFQAALPKQLSSVNKKTELGEPKRCREAIRNARNSMMDRPKTEGI